ncbi:hypothetical protein [Pantanalinema sp. GBBB05]|uniref:hypothetical protein n=1 Tax=Pantanalinema sp. GBBB05 TaxID=2604139 RepID=UPI003D816027
MPRLKGGRASHDYSQWALLPLSNSPLRCNGFNVYQPLIAGHIYVNPAQTWPQVDLKPEIANPLKAKVQKGPVLQNYFANLQHTSTGFFAQAPCSKWH